jgi:hypothetical protein
VSKSKQSTILNETPNTEEPVTPSSKNTNNEQTCVEKQK